MPAPAARAATLALLLAACAPPPPDGLSRELAFITAASDLRDPGGPRPEIRRASAAEIARHSGARALDGSRPVGIYLPESHRILVRRDQPDDVLVHELTHWLQHAAGHGPGCAAEAEAYRLQSLWRTRQGLPAEARIDPCDTRAYAALAGEVVAELARRAPQQ